MLKLDCCFITDSGKIRTNNEDNFFICGTYKRTPEELRYRKKDFVYRGGIFAVCDGILKKRILMNITKNILIW